MEITHRKVVTLDEVVKLTEESHDEDDNRLLVQENNNFTSFNNASDKQRALKGSDELLLGNQKENPEEHDEELDQLGGLPEDWPNIPSLFRRRSCLLTNAKSTCVNKATSHLELLQNVIEEWFKDHVSRASQASTKQSPARESSVLSRDRKQLHFKSRLSTPSMATTADSLDVSAYSRMSEALRDPEQLSVQGIGAVVDKDKKQQKVTIKGPDLNIPDLGAEDVIDECITLLARLEKDRLETEEALACERERVRMLSMRIDDLAQRRLREMPLAVQKEHETSSMDIYELQWHLTCRIGGEKQFIRKQKSAEIGHHRVKEDMEFIKRHAPLMQEKLAREQETMARIVEAQAKATEKLNAAINSLKHMEQKSDEANTEAESKRAHMKADLDDIRDYLQSLNDDLSEAIGTYIDYISQCAVYQQQIDCYRQELSPLEVENENSKAAEAVQSEKVQKLEFELNQLTDEHQRLENEIRQLLSDKEMKQSKNAALENQLKDRIEKAEVHLRDVRRKNQESLMDIEDFITAIKKCAQQKIADQKNLVRMNKEMQKTEEQLRMTLDELGKVTTVNSAQRKQLQEQDALTYREDRLRMTVDALKREIKEEENTCTVIAETVTSSGEEIIRAKDEHEEKKVEVEEKVEEMVTAVKKVTKKVEKLRTTRNDKGENINEVKAKLESVRSQRKDLEAKLTDRLNQLESHHRQLKEDVIKAGKRLDHMAWRTKMIKQKFEDMSSSTQMMNKATAKTNRAVAILTEEMDELSIQLESSQKIEDDLKQSLDEVKSRMKNNDEQHKELIEERNCVHEQLEVDLKASIIVNKELASRYRQLQNEFIISKNKMLNTYDHRLKLEESVKDIKQLQSLQKRMHYALQLYYKYRGTYNKSELTRLREESHKNGTKISTVQDQMNNATLRVTNFLQNTVDITGGKKESKMNLQGQGKIAVATARASKPSVAMVH